MKKIVLTVAYDGTDYHGWQRQKNGISIQQCLEEALSRLYQMPAPVIGASRTDAGVHAYGQTVLFTGKENIPMHKIPLALRAFLPEDIVVLKAQPAPEGFHPQYDAVQKTYRYHIDTSPLPDPFKRRYAEHEPALLDISQMKAAASCFIGTHDFASFCAAGSSVKTTVRTIFDCSVEKQGTDVFFWVTGNGFLYNMVRIMAGTLIQVGKKKRAAEEIPPILLSGKRKMAGKTAAAKGLTLMEIKYDKI